jgi:hypothetical protein
LKYCDGVPDDNYISPCQYMLIVWTAW